MSSRMSDQVPTVFVVDDDEPVRDAVAMLLETVDLPCETFSSARDFLDTANRFAIRSCWTAFRKRCQWMKPSARNTLGWKKCGPE